MDHINGKSMAARLITAQREADCGTERGGADDSLKSGRERRCGGCSGRCFCVSETEFALILDYAVRNLSRENVLWVIDNSKSQMELLEQNFREVSDKLEGKITLGELLGMAGISLPFPCVFFNEADGGCKVFEVRPLICRSFGGSSACKAESRGSYSRYVSQNGVISPGFLEEFLSFIFLENHEGGCVIIRRPAPLFYFFSLVFKDMESEDLAEIEFCVNLLKMDEKEYIEKLIGTAKAAKTDK